MVRLSDIIVSIVILGVIAGQNSMIEHRRSRLHQRQQGQSPRVIRYPAIQSRRRSRPLAAGPRHELAGPSRLGLRRSSAEIQAARLESFPTESTRLRSPTIWRRLGIPHNYQFEALHRQPLPMRISRIQPATPRATRILPSMPRATRILPSMPRATRILPAMPIASRILPAMPRATRILPAMPRVSQSPSATRAEDIFARHVEVIDGTRIGTARPTRLGSGGSMTRSPLHTRARLSHPANQRWQPIRRTGERRHAITSRNIGGNKVRSTTTGQKDMIAVNDVISLVNAIKGSRGTSTTQNPSSGTSSGSKIRFSINGGHNIRPSIAGNKQRATSSAQNHNSIASSGSKNSISINGGSNTRRSSTGNQQSRGTSILPNGAISGQVPVDGLVPSMDLLTQFAIMNAGEGGLFNNIMSDPLFLSQIPGEGVGTSSSGLSVISPTPTKHRTGESRSKTENGRRRTDVIIHPSLLQPSGVVIQPPLQHGSNRELATEIRNNIRENIQETTQELKRDIQELPPFFRQLVFGQGV